MADDLPLSVKDTYVPKRSPLVVKMVILVFAMAFGIYVCLICLKQVSFVTISPVLSVQVSDKPCPNPNLEQWEVPYVHYPKPNTYSRAECACNPVRYFAILSTQRSGSGWFETLLNSHMNVSSHGEIFSNKDRRSNISSIMESLDRLYNLDWNSSSSKNECTAAVGLKWMLNQGLMQHHEEILKYFNSKGVSLIFLFRRNLLRRMISILANTYDRDYKLLNGTHKSHVHSVHEAKILASYKPLINATTLIPELTKVHKMTTNALTFFNSTRHVLVYYEDVVKNNTKLIDFLAFLRVPRMNLSSRQVKIHKGNLSEQVANWDDILRTLNGTEYERFLHTDYT